MKPNSKIDKFTRQDNVVLPDLFPGLKKFMQRKCVTISDALSDLGKNSEYIAPPISTLQLWARGGKADGEVEPPQKKKKHTDIDEDLVNMWEEDDPTYTNEIRRKRKNKSEKKEKTGKNGNLSWDSVCSTVFGSFQHLKHPLWGRGLTIREAARIQTFPDWFQFYGKSEDQERQIRNAVPPVLGFFVAKQIVEASKGDEACRINGSGVERHKFFSAIPIPRQPCPEDEFGLD